MLLLANQLPSLCKQGQRLRTAGSILRTGPVTGTRQTRNTAVAGCYVQSFQTSPYLPRALLQVGDEALQQALAESQEQVAAAQGVACNHHSDSWQHTSLALTSLLCSSQWQAHLATCHRIVLHVS